jgi:thioesterase domain-containing protein
LGRAQPFYALQAIGLDGQRTPLSRIEDMATHYLQEIRTIQPHGPYLFGGASFGGLVAYEMAQQAAQRGEPSGLVILLDSGPVERLKQKREAQAREPARLPHRLQLHWRGLSQLGWAQRRAYLAEGWTRLMDRKARQRRHRKYLAAQAAGKTVGELNEYLLVCHRAAAHRYRFQPYSGGVVLCLAEEKPPTQAQDLVEAWRDLVHEHLTVLRVPGDHWTMNQEPHVRILADRLGQLLETWAKSGTLANLGDNQ